MQGVEPPVAPARLSSNIKKERDDPACVTLRRLLMKHEGRECHDTDERNLSNGCGSLPSFLNLYALF